MPFDRFSGRFTLEGRLVALTGVRVGAAPLGGSLGTDRAIVRDGVGRPYIPGASLKGALRAEVERLVRTVRPGRACYPTGADAERCVSVARWQELRQRAAGATDDGDSALTRALLEASCWVCRLFGSSYLASRVQFADAPVADASWLGQAEVRQGVGIDRDTGTVRSGSRFDFEVVPAGAEFACRLRVDTDDPRLLGMLALGVRELESGRLVVGGGRSQGLGRVLLEVERRALVSRDAESLLAYLADTAGDTTGVAESEVAAWTAAFLECLRSDHLPQEAD